MDQDLWMKSLYYHGPDLLQTILSDPPDVESEEEKEKINIYKFIKRKLNLLFEGNALTNSQQECESTIPTMPVELFQNGSHMQRRDLFFKSLDRGDILSLQVINDTLPDNYKLLVISKHEGCMKLDDLSLLMYLPKLQPEMNLAGGELHTGDLIRAAVCSCSIDERKLYVTLDNNILDDEVEHVQLGKISHDELPPYIGKVNVGASYVEYLHHLPAFNNPNWSEELYNVLNLKRKYLYSFFEEWNGKSYPLNEYGKELKKQQNLALSNTHYKKGLEHYEAGNSTEAFMFFHKALAIDPENTDALVSRGILYANTNDLSKALADMEEALRIDSTNENARKQMSLILIAAAEKHIEQNNMISARAALNSALDLDPENRDVIQAVERETYNTQPSAEKSFKKSASSFGKTWNVSKKKKSYATSSSSESTSSKKDGVKKDKYDSSLPFGSKRMKKRHHHKQKKSRHHKRYKSRSRSASRSRSRSRSPKWMV